MGPPGSELPQKWELNGPLCHKDTETERFHTQSLLEAGFEPWPPGPPSPVHCTAVQPWQPPHPPSAPRLSSSGLLTSPASVLSQSWSQGHASQWRCPQRSGVHGKPGPELVVEKRGPLSGLSILLWEAVPLPPGSQAACQASLSSPSPQLRHAEPSGYGPSSPVRPRGAHGGCGVNLALLCSDMPLPEGRGFLKLAPVLSAEVCPNVSQE